MILLFIWIFFSGKRKNKILQAKYLQKLKESKFSDYIQKYNLNEPSSSNYSSYNCAVKAGSGIKNFEIHFSLEDRQSLINWVIALFSGAKDFIIIETDLPRSKSIFGFEIIAWKEKNQREGNKKLLATMQHFDVSDKFDSIFLVKTTDTFAAKHFFKESKKLLGMIYAARNTVMRISVQRLKSPNVRILAHLDEKTNLDLLADLFIQFVKNVDEIASKDFIKRKIKTGKKKKK